MELELRWPADETHLDSIACVLTDNRACSGKNFDGQDKTLLMRREKRLRRRLLVTKVERSLPPRIGALPSQSHDAAQPKFSNDALEYTVKVMLPKLLPGEPDAWSTWLAFQCRSLACFHAMHWAAAVHRDLLRNSLSFTLSSQAIRHKIQCLNELRRSLDEDDFADHDDLESLILTVATLWSNEVDVNAMAPAGGATFSPHMPTANWTAVYGRTHYVPTHAIALGGLIDRIGGLRKLKNYGLARTIALGDMLHCSRGPQIPQCPRMWTYDPTILRSHRLMHARSGGPGRGFFVSLPGILPSPALATYVRLATLDRRLEFWRKQTAHTPDSDRSFAESRNALHHDLLSLPPWSEVEEDSSISEAVYESCRLAAIIYSNAVIMAIPMNGGWPSRLAEQLQAHLQHAEDLSSMGFYLWALYVGGVASLNSPLWPAYRKALNQTWAEDQGSWQKIDMVLEQFLWSPMACSEALTLLRQSL